MSHYKPYPAYKDSGVEWIGQIPDHWETLRIKRGALLRNERRNDSPEGWPYVGLEDVEPESGRYAPTPGASRQFDDSMVGVFRARDVLYGKLRPYLRKAIVAEEEGICSTEFLVLSAERAKAAWLHRWLLTPEVTQQIEAGCEGAKMPRADWEHVGSIPMPLPPSEEQSTITAALDRETAHIDALIAKKTRFIELLKEKRQALITHAVTKGLDPNVKMKDSGVEWIGEVPEQWGIKRLKWVLSRRIEKNDPIQTQDILSLTIAQGVVPLADKEGVGGNLPKDDLSAYDIARPGDLVINSMNVIVGAVGLSRYFGAISPVYYAMYPTLNTTSIDYYHYLFRSSQFQESLAVLGDGILVKKSESSGKLNTIRLKISYETLGDQLIPVPPPREQAALAATLDRATSRIDLLAKTTGRSISLLRERRSALITAAVTGKIDLTSGDNS